MSNAKHVEGRARNGLPWRMRYEVSGQGPDLLLLHGAGPGATGPANFSRSLETLSRYFKCWVIDFPGFGGSSKNLNVFGSQGPFYAAGAAVLAFMDAAGLKRAHVIGTSLGAAAVLCASMDSPQRFAKIVAVAPGGGVVAGAEGPTESVKQLFGYYAGEGPSLPKMRQFLHGLVYDATQLPEALVEQRYQSSIDPDIMANPPIAPTAGGVDKNFLISLDPRLRLLNTPALFVWGLQDACNPVAALESFQVMPNADYLLMANCGHWPHWEHASKFNTFATAFLKED